MDSRNIEPVILMQFGGRWDLEADRGGRCKETVRLASRLRVLQGKHGLGKAVHSSIHHGWSLSWSVVHRKIPTEPSRVCWGDSSETSASGDPGEQVTRGSHKSSGGVEEAPGRALLCVASSCSWPEVFSVFVFFPLASCSLSAAHFAVFPGDFL